jgi:hypothetical protein
VPLAKGALVAITLSGKILGREAALGKLLLRSPRGAGAALVASGPVTPAAGVVVFVVVAGHEGLTEGVKCKVQDEWRYARCQRRYLT